ncbi:MAG: GTP-binding protein [Cyanobacteria bacterium P01_H01_bin.119]
MAESDRPPVSDRLLSNGSLPNSAERVSRLPSISPAERSHQDGPLPAYLEQARHSLKRAIARYGPKLHLGRLNSEDLRRQAKIKDGIEQLTRLSQKLNGAVLRVAVFGLVSRGKSAVINALLGEKLLQTGPLNGVTQWPRSVYWSPPLEAPFDRDRPLQLELIDTPGLDEISGQGRATMAQDIVQQADLILFVVAGDITRREYQALVDLKASQKPLLLVFNKIDLYPDTDRAAIARNLQTLWEQADTPESRTVLSVDDIVCVAAEPAPVPVQVEWPDGRVTQEWETPVAEMEQLKTALKSIVRREGKVLLALNALHQAKRIESTLAAEAVALHQQDADGLIWQFAKYKAIAVAVNPIAVLDMAGGVATDLALIRALSKLYGLPMTGYEAGKLWQAILRSSGAALLSELGSGLLLGFGKSAAAAASLFDSASGIAALAGAMTAQAGAAGYGTYAVGYAAKRYLEQGCTWGRDGIDTVMTDLLNQIEPDSLIERLQREVEQL